MRLVLEIPMQGRSSNLSSIVPHSCPNGNTCHSLPCLDGERHGMDGETFMALLEEGWTPPGQIPELLTVDRVTKALHPRSTSKDGVTELPEPDTYVAGVPLWLRLTVERHVAGPQGALMDRRLCPQRQRRGTASAGEPSLCTEQDPRQPIDQILRSPCPSTRTRPWTLRHRNRRVD